MLQTLERIRETMERKIKFRGKTVSGRWVYGDLLHITNTDGISGTIIVKENQATAQSTDYDNALCYARNEIDVVIPDTVGQFTGLLDKNGKEIYEGDIVSRNYSIYTELGFLAEQVCDINYIGFRQSECKFIVVCKNHHHDLREPYNRQVEIIGNFFDNSDLLDTKDGH